ncbi:hypothetical protein JKP88DRAFT_272602 [Tribonema minus]|uniref:Uncharacterized protein n=1 Tax=Tribonema minus TaxID=303371 RepID=A0A836CHM9_9STRA|nr:hypothetical protein JKP88DRAFT_272602 [Tribonema minus]
MTKNPDKKPAKRGAGKKPAKKVRKKRTAEEVAEAKKKTAEDRAKVKTDTDVNNLRNRLFKAFGDAIRLKNGELPSAVKLLSSLLLRTFGVLKRGKDEVRPERVSTIPIGLKTVLRDSPIEGITVDTIINKFTAVSDHASKVRVNASLLANYIFIRALQEDDQLPVANAAFFKACLSCCRGAVTGCVAVKQRFVEFSAATGITAYQPMPGTTRVFENQADDMAVAAKTFIKVHFNDRRQTLLKWGLKVKLRGRVPFNQKVFERRVGELCSFVLSDRSEMDVMAALRDELQRLGFNNCFDDIEQLCCTVMDFYGSDDPSKLRHLLELQEMYLTEDRRQYDSICSEAYTAFPKLQPDDTNKEARQALLDQWLFYEAPPKIMSPLPINHNAATFIRLCRKSICELFPKLNVCIEDGDPWWYKVIMDPFSKDANIPRLRTSFNKAIQRATEEIAERVAPIKGGRQLYGKRLVLFEDGVWKPKKGCAAAPLKKIVRACSLSTVFSMADAKSLGAKTLSKAVPVGVKRLVGENTFQKIDVGGDGHCGAYCLALLMWSITGDHYTPAQIRAQLAAHAKHMCGALTADQREFYQYSVREDRYLESFDMGIYAMSCSVNAAILGETMDKRRHDNTRKQVYNAVVISYSPHNPVWVFFLTTSGNRHFQLLVRGESTAKCVCPTFSCGEAQHILAQCGAPYPNGHTDPCDAVQHIMFIADDFVYF